MTIIIILLLFGVNIHPPAYHRGLPTIRKHAHSIGAGTDTRYCIERAGRCMPADYN